MANFLCVLRLSTGTQLPCNGGCKPVSSYLPSPLPPPPSFLPSFSAPLSLLNRRCTAADPLLTITSGQTALDKASTEEVTLAGSWALSVGLVAEI